MAQARPGIDPVQKFAGSGRAGLEFQAREILGTIDILSLIHI